MLLSMTTNIFSVLSAALAVWGTAVHPSIDHHLRIAELAGCYDGAAVDKAKIVKCMQDAPVNDLLQALDSYSVSMN